MARIAWGSWDKLITILPDFREEGWHSMDLCADMLVKYAPPKFELRMSVPQYRKRLGFLPLKKANNFDRWYNRWRVYPGHLKKLAFQPGFFHIVDHSYAHLANYLPEGRAGVYCHDLDAFKCLLTPDLEPRPDWFKKMISRVFEGLKRACRIFCSTRVTQEMLLSLGHWNSDAIQVAPYGIAEEFQPEGPKEPGDFLLHVGSCIPRKRLDVLLDAFAKVSKYRPSLRLIQAGGSFTTDHRQKIRDMGLESRIEQRQNLTREDLACLYRGAKCLVITSDAEGFGLPVIEGLSCGTKVVASDIPTLKEVGGIDINYFAPGDPDACSESVLNTLETQISFRHETPGRWSWTVHAQRICSGYQSMGNSK